MIPEEQYPSVHHMTVKGARNALAHRLISQDSYRAVLRGEISLADGKAFGRGRGPSTPECSDGPGQVSSGPREARTSRPCMCSCGGTTKGGRFLPAHDARLHAELKRNLEKDPLLRNERFTDEQKAYARERGLI